jgi:F-type H+-transporting ATPase subunit delta
MAEDISARDARFAAEADADVGVEAVGEVYAEALLGMAEKTGQTEQLLEEFDSFVADVLNPFPVLEEVLASRLVSHEEKSGILDRVLGSQASRPFLNFLKVVSRHERLDLVRSVHRKAHEVYDRMRGRVRVRLATATPVADALAARVADGLRGLLDGEPVLERVTDPDLIGGAVVRVGDTVFDGSIANQLKLLRKQMIDRSAHEIQSRRDRFRYPAGD